MISNTPDGQFGVALMHGEHSIVVLVGKDTSSLNEFIRWGLTPEAAAVIQTAIQTRNPQPQHTQPAKVKVK